MHVLVRSTWLPLQARRTSPVLRSARTALRDPAVVLLAHPWPRHVLRPLAVAAGVRVVGDPRCHHDVALGQETVAQARDGVPVLNARSTDLSKTHVAAVFAEVFGYPLAVHPTRHVGPLVEKSDRNNTHDGRVLAGPLPAGRLSPGRVHQRLVDTVVDGPRGPEAVDLRTPLYGGRVPLVCVKRRPLSDRFGVGPAASVEVREASEVFTADELAALARFAAAMGLDYGEADVLRDADGRVYVVDVTHGPSGPPPEMSRTEATALVERMAAALLGLLRDPGAVGPT